MKWDDIDENLSRSDKGFEARKVARGWHLIDPLGDYLTDCTGVPHFGLLSTAKRFANAMYKLDKPAYDRAIKGLKTKAPDAR